MKCLVLFKNSTIMQFVKKIICIVAQIEQIFIRKNAKK